MIRCRSDLHFMMITKRIDSFSDCLPDDWGDGYDNVTICCTVENQACADYRLPIYKRAPIKHKIIICEPLLERIDLENHFETENKKLFKIFTRIKKNPILIIL